MGFNIRQGFRSQTDSKETRSGSSESLPPPSWGGGLAKTIFKSGVRCRDGEIKKVVQDRRGTKGEEGGKGWAIERVRHNGGAEGGVKRTERQPDNKIKTERNQGGSTRKSRHQGKWRVEKWEEQERWNERQIQRIIQGACALAYHIKNDSGAVPSWWTVTRGEQKQ